MRVEASKVICSLAKGHSVGLSGCFDERIVHDIKSSNYCTEDKVSKAYARLVFIHNVTKFAKVMFLHLSVCPQWGGGSASVHAWIPHPPGSGTPPRDLAPPSPIADGYCCGRYASDWNAFLLYYFFHRRLYNLV